MIRTEDEFERDRDRAPAGVWCDRDAVLELVTATPDRWTLAYAEAEVPATLCCAAAHASNVHSISSQQVRGCVR